MSLGLTLAISYADLAAFLVTSKLVRGPCLPARDIGLEARPMPATQTGLSVIFLAFSELVTSRHAAPSALAQQSNSFRGLESGGQLSTSSTLKGFLNIDSAVLAPDLLFV